MIYSMTGYGRAQRSENGQEITAEIKSVNHRYFEFSSRIPRTMGFLEEKLKSYVYTCISRGKVDVTITIITLDGAPAQVQINEELCRSYVEALRGVKDKLDLKDDLTLSVVARLGDIFTVRKVQADEDAIWQLVEPVLKDALEQFREMRAVEGSRLAEDILLKLQGIEDLTAKVEELSPLTVDAYRRRLTLKLEETLERYKLDEARVLTEAAIFAEKISVDEETVRLRSHIAQLRSMLECGSPVGRKLDFLVQEMNREANTIGSKCQDASVAAMVVELKSEIEKIREQVQNIE